MGRSQGLLCLLLLCLGFSVCSAGVSGTEFITAFLQNDDNRNKPTLGLAITALQDSTTGSVLVKNVVIQTFTVNKLETTRVQLPPAIQLVGSVISPNVVSIKSNKPVSVVSFNFKDETAESASLFPVTELGTDYYIVTPPEGSSKEFAIIAKESTTLTITPTGALTLIGKKYSKGKPFFFISENNQVVQFQSDDDLSGTKIQSTKPVAVLTGHTCSMKFTKCDHVYEQLQPTFNWGSTFFIPTASYQTNYDLVYISAATDNTLVTYQAGSLKLNAGDVREIKLMANAPLFINSTEGIQVLYYSTGGQKKGITYDPVFMNVPDVTSFCSSFQTVNLESFSNEAVLVAKTSDLNAITVDKASLGTVNWKTIQGTEYSWGEFPLTSGSKQYVFENSKSPFSVSVLGVSSLNAFGEVATCIGGYTRQSCSQVSCRTKEVCKIDNGIATCHETGEATCWASGDPHYHTFDGNNYDFQGTCSYTMAKTCDPDLPFFNIETVNENRGSSRVSYLKFVSIQVYNDTITGMRSEIGVVRVNNQKVQLPLTLNSGKVTLFQSGTALILQTDFKLRVLYDWNILLKITVTSSYFNSICGLCGNYNGNQADDLSNGGKTLSPVEYGKLWKVNASSDADCHDDCGGECVPCTSIKEKHYSKEEYCGILTKRNGPFSACTKVIKADIYEDNCVYDMCLNDGFNQILCQTLKAFSDACAREGIQVGEWRSLTNCSMDCPANSTLNPCGSACPATCLDPTAPSKCTEHCIEVCECDAGYVMIEGTCQPKKNCGCQYQGRFINPGDSFWNDTKCMEKCSCNKKTRQVECNKMKCPDKQTCDIQDGIQDCYPNRYATCSASGDPHYVTFDDFHYDFQGACPYLFSGLCTKKEGLADFQLIVYNDNLGSRLVSYTTGVTFKIFGTEVQIRREFPAAVLVNGIKTNLPFAIKSKLGNINIFQSGRQGIVQTNIGIRVAFDWEARVGLTLPSTYSGYVCGLCGNFNDNAKDDLIDRSGNFQTDYALFGHSWREGPNADKCQIPIGGNCTNRLRLQEEQKKNLMECGMVLNKKGPFRNCHSKIDPKTYFDDCVYDMCAYGRRQDLICRLLSGYAALCQDEGVVIYEWRSDLCPTSCPANSKYNISVSGCPSTCLSLTMSTQCDPTPREGCECDPGYVLSGTECVPLSQCGCLYNGQYYKSNEIFYPENTCENECTCNPGGAVTCEPTSCGPYEECSIVKGVQSCNPIGTAVCSAIGRTTFNTFDNFGYDFIGNCSYILSQTCLSEGSKLTPYVIRIRNVDGSVSISKEVILEVNNYNVTLLQGAENQILVNGILRSIPFELDAGSLRADYYSGGIVLKTSFGLLINLDNAVHVTVPGNYHTQTCGLCGNYNDNKNDDLNPNTDDIVAFVESWKKAEDFCVTDEICKEGDLMCSNCNRASQKMYSGENLCGFLTSPSGPFSPCHGAIDPKVYQKSCVYSLCTKTGELCTILQGYAKLCQDAGIAIKPWRTETFCPYTCSQENSHYELCADVCSTSCSSLYDITSCPQTCSEGCQCNQGYFFQNGICVTPDLCDRCFLNGTFYKKNETIISEDCGQTCTCTPQHVMVCQPYSCASDEICTVLNGKVQCINKDPCKSITCRNKEHCETQDGGSPACVPDYSKSCTIWGDPHFTTFDDFSFDFHGTCTYVLATYTGSDTTLEYFHILEKNDNRGSLTSSSVRLINIFVYNYNISILKDEPGQVRLNDEIINLPLVTDKISITQSGEFAILKTAFGLKVEYDYNWHVEITLPSSYYAAIGGLCGNFNANPRDDKVSPDNKPMTVITKWAKSWKVYDEDTFCQDSCQGNCADCNETVKSLYEGEEHCGLLEADDGPFKDCHDVVSTAIFFDNCVKDVCSHDGIGLCQAFEAYVSACRKKGVLIPEWRKITGCDMNCPENSHYEFCGTACPATCLDKTAPDRCTELCRETCQCDEGYVFSAGQCVAILTCGCMYKDLYYKPNQEFWSDDKCTVRCRCDPKLGMVVCQKDKCSDKERCMLRGGVRDCYPVSFSHCISTGDPHYTTFDGKKYDFMGSCIYQLTGLCPAMDPNLTPFQVKIENDRRGSKSVSFTKSLTLEVYNYNITLSRDYPRKVLVNGVTKFLPFSLESNKIKAFMTGEHAFIRTDFDVTMNFNWETLGRVTVPNTYADSLCGLCGNFNQDPNDDLTPDEDETEFEKKYRVGETTECTAGCVGDCPKCKKEDTKKFSDEKYCGIIKKPDGPFSQCINVIDPTSYFHDCLYDSCVSGGHYSATCGAIARYASDCQENGITIQNWRIFTICDPVCPPNSHYELCGPGCHETCSSLSSASDCQKTCTEGCYCDSGFVLSGDTCVPLSDCGCDFQDNYYQSGQSFYVDGKCSEQCQCVGGVVQCQPAPCAPNEECKVVNGAIGCHSNTTGTCQVAGNRQFITYDAFTYSLQGSCSFTLTEVCSKDLELGKFSVKAKGGSFGKNNIVGIQSLEVNVHGYEIIMDRESQWKVRVNEEIHMLPLILDSGKVQINQEGSSIVLQTDLEVVVRYDTIDSVHITVPSVYKGDLCGQCGDFNGHLEDDLHLLSDQLSTITEGSGDDPIDDSCRCKYNCEGCDNMRKAIFSRDESCGLLLKKDGPFASCYGLVNVTDYFDQCLFDMCASDGQAEILCRSLQAYAAACQAAGAKIQSWRRPDFCNLVCPANSHYELCADTCDDSCSAVSISVSCTEQCSEGCECDDGYLFDAGQCVSMENCGCVYNGRYYKLGESVVSSDCLQQCTCQNDGLVECSQYKCSDDEYCGLQEGKHGCIKRHGTCTLSTEGRLVSFDNLSGSITPDNTFDLASVCSGGDESWFRIVVITQSCKNDEDFISAVHVYFHQFSVALSAGGQVWLNGRTATLPLTSGAVTVQSTHEGLLVRSGEDLELRMSDDGDLTLNVHQKFSEALCGACGNFNRQKSDDLQIPEKKSVSGFSEFITYWRAQDFVRCGP